MHDENFMLIKNRDFFLQNILKRIGLKKRPFYLLFRDPIRKLESFYANKIILPDDFSKWEHCQEIFFNYLKITEETPDAEKVIAFNSMSYEKFIALLPHLFSRDLHLAPQADAVTVTLKKLNILVSIEYDDIFDIGNHTRIKTLEKLVNIQFEHRNRSNIINANYYYSSEMKRTIETVYKRDLEIYNTIQNN